MKATTLFIITAVAFLMACTKDNFKKPASTISGRVVYQGTPVAVRSNGVQLELWQRGYQLFTKVPIYISPEGTFSTQIFDGDYLLTRLRGNGPWADNTDTIRISLKGTANVDVPVDPYFMVKGASFTFSKPDTILTGSVTMQRVNTTRNLELVRLYIGQTALTDQGINLATSDKGAAAIPDASQPVTVTLKVPASVITTKDYVYARFGVKTVGVTELMYSAPFKVMLK